MPGARLNRQLLPDVDATAAGAVAVDRGSPGNVLQASVVLKGGGPPSRNLLILAEEHVSPLGAKLRKRCWDRQRAQQASEFCHLLPPL
mmetsp:Transcript_163700/g.520216  ORF Transcript_163700/g.520216 Transcript_163700/m.520216 type:complete len:88 (+) Transcript_163700:288-551(+)